MLICNDIIMFPDYIERSYRVYMTYIDTTGRPVETRTFMVPGDVNKCKTNYWDSKVEGNFALMRLVLKC